MPTNIATDTSKQCSITNKSGKDIALLEIVPTGETGSSNSIPIGSGSLEVLKTSNGDTVIKAGASGVVTLDRSSDEGDRIQNYDLIVSDSTWLYPIGLLAVSQQTDNDTTSYPSQTITTDSGTAMAQAELFYQTIAAYPNSQLCQDYVAALKAAKDAAEAKADGSPQSADAVASAIEDALQSFFKGTTSYNQVTLAHLAAVDAYHNQFPFAWARYKDGFTYYLYGTDGTSSLFAGTLSLKKTGAVDVTKRNGSYTCSFVPAVAPTDLSKTDVDVSKAINLTYANALFVDDPGAANPKIALRGDYMLNRMFTVNGDDNSIVTIVSGAVNGVTYIGLDSPQKSNAPVQPAAAASSLSDDVVKYFDQITHPKNMTDWVVSIATLVGALLVIPALASAVYGIYRIAKYKKARQEALAKDIIEEVTIRVNDEVEVTRIKWATSDKGVIPEFGLDMLREVVDAAFAVPIKQALAGSLSMQKYAAREMLQFSTVMDAASQTQLQTMLSSIKQSEKNVAQNGIDETLFRDNNMDSFPEKLKALQAEYQTFADNQVTFESLYKKINQALSDEARAEIEGAMSSVSLIFNDLQHAQDEDSASEREKDPKAEDQIEPELV